MISQLLLVRVESDKKEDLVEPEQYIFDVRTINPASNSICGCVKSVKELSE